MRRHQLRSNILWNPKVHYRVHSSTGPYPEPDQSSLYNPILLSLPGMEPRFFGRPAHNLLLFRFMSEVNSSVKQK
jgi:hypothetical protein